MNAIKNYLAFFFILLLSTTIHSEAKSQKTYDVVIYGGTSAAVIAAVEVAQSGKSVILVSPDIHLGGLTAGGLGWTDTGKKEVIGGLARNFYQRVYNRKKMGMSEWKEYWESDYPTY